MKKNLVILGSTGSIGRSLLKIISKDRKNFNIILLSANKNFTQKLISWYKKNKRPLPFRKSKDPYKIWLSEIMLQQTQIKTALPYYNKWIKKYPTLDSVAKSNIDDLLKIWEGLGYYSRCRNFHKASIKVFEDYNSKIPEDFDQFKELPGVGEYTAGAVLSIAFKKKIPAIDTNILRVMSRILGLKKRSKSNLNKIKKNMIGFLNTEKPVPVKPDIASKKALRKVS